MIYDVPLIPQATKMGCWAASIAMILAWRNHASFDPQYVAANFGGLDYTPNLINGLDPNDTYILRRNGFNPVAPQCYTPDGISGLLDTYGPLWVASWAPGAHIRVVCGINGTTVWINDPEPVNVGSQYARSFGGFFGQMETLGSMELKQRSPVYVAYLSR